MRVYFAISILMLFMLASCSVEESDQYTEFTFEDTNPQPIPQQETPAEVPQEESVHTITVVETPVPTTITQPAPAVPDVPSEKELFSCKKDDDCMLVQPTTCCACPLAINIDAEKNFPTLALGETPSCTNDYLCGSCASPDDLKVRCVESRCRALLQEQIEELDKPKEIPESEIVRYPAPEVDPASQFKSVLIKPTCLRDYPAVYLLYELKSPVVTTLEVREESESEFSTLRIEDKNLFKIEEKIVLCPTCNILQYPVLRTDKKYYLRIRADFNGEMTYAGEYIIDTSSKSEYIVQNC